MRPQPNPQRFEKGNGVIVQRAECLYFQYAKENDFFLLLLQDIPMVARSKVYSTFLSNPLHWLSCEGYEPDFWGI